MAATTSRYVENIFKDFHDQLDDIREKELFCDVRIKLINGEKCAVSVHRAVLASCSPFFRSLFTTTLAESGQVELELPGISCKDMEAVITYAYTNKAELTPDSVESIFMTADRLHVFGLLKLCADYLSDSIDPQNVIGIWNLAYHFNCHKLIEKSWSYIIANFLKIIESSAEFLQLTVDDFSYILKVDNLNLRNENVACKAIVKWVQHHKKRRRNYHQLLSCVRLALVDKTTFDDLLSKEEDIISQKTCKELINQAYSLCQIHRQTKISFYQASSLYMLKPRIPHEVIFILGGWTNDSVCGHIETYDSRVDKWYSLKTSLTEKPLAYHALVPFGRYIYVIGGFTTYACVNTVRRWDPVEKEWDTVAPMHAKRCYVGCGSLDGYIYACGGYDGQTRHNSVERFNPTHNHWSYVHSMLTVRSDSGVCELNGKLYVCGGFDGHSCLDSVEVYSPLANQWSYIEDMSIHRSGVSVTKLNGFLYAIGGFDGRMRLNSVEKYDHNMRRWSTVKNMSLARSNFAVTTLEGNLYAIGGFNGVSTSHTVEYYNPTKDEWKVVSSLLVGRSATSACTMYKLPNVTDFTFYGSEQLHSSQLTQNELLQTQFK